MEKNLVAQFASTPNFYLRGYTRAHAITDIFKDECGVPVANAEKASAHRYFSTSPALLLRRNFCTLRALRQRVAGDGSRVLGYVSNTRPLTPLLLKFSAEQCKQNYSRDGLSLQEQTLLLQVSVTTAKFGGTATPAR